jgi:hypothetical protein
MACFDLIVPLNALANCQRSYWCINGVNDTGNACIAGVVDTGEAPKESNISAHIRKNRNRY